LAELYAATGRRVFREGYQRHLAAGAFRDPSAYSAGLALCALTEGMEALKRDDLAPDVAAAFAELSRGVLSQVPPSRLGHPPETVLFRGLARGPLEALTRRAWSAALQRALWMGLTPYGRCPSLWRAAEAVASMEPLALEMPEWSRGMPLGIAPFSGSDRRFTIRVEHGRDEPVVFTLCHSFADPPDHTQRYRVRAELRDPLGRVIAREVLEGEQIEARTMALPRWGPAGDYFLSLVCEDDGFVEVVTSHPRVYLRADEWRAARYAYGRARFYLKGPRGGELRVATAGSAALNGDALIAATLRDLSGKRVASARWAVPLLGIAGEDPPPTRSFPPVALRLAVPVALRGQPLLLEMNTPRGVAWRLEGLDEPWLAPVPEAFR
jgi:hypothetical protein